MTGNRSLDEFLAEADDDASDRPAAGAAQSPSDGRPDESGGREPGAGDPMEAASTVEPLAETFAWSASGGTCATCGEPAETRWRDGGSLVCPACKEW